MKELQDALSQVTKESNNDTILLRANWMKSQLTAFGRRIKIFSGENKDFDVESMALFGVTTPVYPETHYKTLVTRLGEILPGSGPINGRFQSLAYRFIIPRSKLDTVFHVAVAESRK